MLQLVDRAPGPICADSAGVLLGRELKLTPPPRFGYRLTRVTRVRNHAAAPRVIVTLVAVRAYLYAPATGEPEVACTRAPARIFLGSASRSSSRSASAARASIVAALKVCADARPLTRASTALTWDGRLVLIFMVFLACDA